MHTIKQRLERHRSEMEFEIQSFTPHYREITDFISPRAARYLTSLLPETNKGSKSPWNSIINNTATLALRTFKSGMMAGASSPARPWFRFTVDEKFMKSAAVKQWLYIVEKTIRDILVKSNFYNVAPQIYGALGAYGTAAQFIEEDDDEVIRCFSAPVGSFMIATNRSGRVDTFYRKLTYTVRQMVTSFGLENCSQVVKNLWDNSKYETTFTVIHAIGPNLDRDPTKLNSKDKPFFSIYYEPNGEHDKILRHAGFDEFPVQAPRWDIEGDDVYGYSCGMQALGDVKQLQFEEKQKAKGIAKHVDPPMLGDAELKTKGSSQVPGGITWIDNLASQTHAAFRPAYQVQPALGELKQDIEAIEYRIRRAFYEDLMQMFALSDNRNITATEVQERHQEKLLVLGPFLERMNDEYYDKSLNRIFWICHRRGLFPPAPKEIEDQLLKIEYTSIMAQAQKLVGSASVERVIGFVGNLMSLGFSSAADKINVDNCIEEYAGMHGTPPTILRSEDEVASVRQAKEQAAQMQQMAALAQPMSQAATAAKTLSETDVSNTGALAQLLGAR